MRSLLSRRRITTARIEPRPNSLLYAFDDCFVLVLDPVEIGAGPNAELRFVRDISQILDNAFARRDRAHDVYGNSPRIKIEHQVRENKKVSAGDITVRIVPRLQTRKAKRLGRVAAVVYDLIK